jgi:thioredoxin-like negative regulator of GroEL
MNEATELELTVAQLLVFHAIEHLEFHHDPDDLDAAVKAALVQALEYACDRPLKPLEELFSND